MSGANILQQSPAPIPDLQNCETEESGCWLKPLGSAVACYTGKDKQNQRLQALPTRTLAPLLCGFPRCAFCVGHHFQLRLKWPHLLVCDPSLRDARVVFRNDTPEEFSHIRVILLSLPLR